MASRLVDNMIAYRILQMLVTPFKDTKAYELGIVDEKGKILRKANTLRTAEEKDAYNYLTRLAFNVKRIINKMPGGESRLRNLVAAYWLVKEHYESGNRSTSQMRERLDEMLKVMDNGLTLVEEEITVKQYLQIWEEVSGAPANATGAAVSTDEPKIFRKGRRKFANFKVSENVLERFRKGKKKYAKWNEYLNLEDESEAAIYRFARRNPSAVIVLQNGDVSKAIRFNRFGGGKWSSISNKKSQDIQVQFA